MSHLPAILRAHLEFVMSGWQLEERQRDAPCWALAAYRHVDSGELRYMRHENDGFVLEPAQSGCQPSS